MVVIIRLYIAWERSWLQYATTNQKKNPENQKNQNRKLWCRNLEHLDSVYTYIISGNRVTLPENWHSSLLHHRTLGTRHPLPPHETLVLHQIIYDYLILYTYIHCQDARDLDIIVFCFLFSVFCFFGFFLVCYFILYSTSLSSYVQPDDGHHYGRNM